MVWRDVEILDSDQITFKALQGWDFDTWLGKSAEFLVSENVYNCFSNVCVLVSLWLNWLNIKRNVFLM